MQRFGISNERQETKVGYNLQKQRQNKEEEEEEEFVVEKQIKVIQKTFNDAQVFMQFIKLKKLLNFYNYKFFFVPETSNKTPYQKRCRSSRRAFHLSRRIIVALPIRAGFKNLIIFNLKNSTNLFINSRFNSTRTLHRPIVRQKLRSSKWRPRSFEVYRFFWVWKFSTFSFF